MSSGASASTRVKLGLFGLLAGAALVATAFVLGIRGFEKPGVPYHTFFDETVQGLEIGAPVKYRGMTIGNVAAVEIAPDKKHVDVTLALRPEDVQRLGLGAPLSDPGLRTQLATQGITGVKLVDLDFFDPRTSPAPELPFETPKNTLPAKPSTLKGLEEGLELTVQRLPALVAATIATLEKIGRILDDLEGARLPAKVALAIDGVGGAIGDLRTILRSVDRARIPDKAGVAIDALGDSAAKVNAILDRVGGDGGLIASTQRATDNLGDLGRAGKGSARDLDRTLRDLDDAARAIRDLAQAIERDPDMLLKGRAREGVR
jgi:ABC-type transporter Mla subunit MlaD